MKKRFSKISTYACLALIIFSAFVPLKAFAYDQDFFAANDILFYNPDDTDCAAESTGSTGSLSLTKSAKLQQIFQLLINGGMNAGQAAAVMGNMYQESGFDSDRHEGGNNIGYGLAQWSFGRRTNLERFAAQKGVPVSDMAMQIEFLFHEYNETYKSLLDKTAFSAGTNIADSTKAWMMIYETPRMFPSNDPAGLNSNRIPAAKKIFGFYSNLASNNSTTPVTTNGCNNSGNGAVAGSIIQTALNFAQPQPVVNGTTNESDAVAAYQQAKQNINPDAEWTDCGGFVATVMISSGVDKNYPKIGVSNQGSYVKSHPDKYMIINSPTVSNLQPGDILIIPDQHTAIYTGNTPYPMVDASLGQRIPSVRGSGDLSWVLSQTGVFAARVLK
jgi:hypothetical protein